MAKQSGRWRAWKWLFTVGFLVAIAAYATASYWSVLWVDGGCRPRILIEDGSVQLALRAGQSLRDTSGTCRVQPGWSCQREPTFAHSFAGIMISLDPLASSVRIPLWVLILVLGLPMAYLWATRPVDPYACTTCGYNLTGNVSGNCPECGSACMPDKRRQHGRHSR